MDSTTIKGIQLLERLASSDAPRGVSDLSRETDLTKSNVQRILATLGSLGYVGKEPRTNRYFATLKMWEVGNRILQRDRILRSAAGALKSLRAQSSETTVLCILDGSDVVYVAKHESENPIRLSCAIGTRLPAYSTATGRVMSAFLPPSERLAIINMHAASERKCGLDLHGRFEQIRELGYEFSEGSYRAGINSVAAPVRESDGSIVASIGLSGPEERLPPERLRELAPKVLDAASGVSSSLGYNG